MLSSQEIEKALTYIDSQERETWIKIGAALKTELGEDGFFVFDKWSQGASNYNERDTKTNWKSFKAGRINIGTLFHYAKQGGYQPQKNHTFNKNNFSEVNKQRLQEQQKIEMQQRQVAKEKSQRIWKNANSVSQHLYLEKKLIQNPKILSQLRQTTINGANLLLVPVRSINGEVSSLQYINEDGTKRFTANGETKGNFLLLGDEDQAKKELILAEGLATASSIYEATGKPVLVTFNAWNMIAVAKQLAKNNYSQNYTLAIDNDSSATGLNKALQAQQYLPNAKIIAPSFSKKEVEEFQEVHQQLPSDFNDKHLLSGLNQIKHQFHVPTTQEQFMDQQTQTNEVNIDSPISYEQFDEYAKMMQSESFEPDSIEIESDELQNGIEALESEIKIKQSKSDIEEITLDDIPQRQKITLDNTSGYLAKENEKIETQTNAQAETEAGEQNPILDLNYDIPESLKKIYIIHQGKFFDNNQNLQFKDFGNQLKTQKTDEQTVRNMIDIAQAKNWQSIKVKGTREFKLQAWLIASERGIEISGFKPDEQELAQLDKASVSQSLANSIEKNQNKEHHQNKNINQDIQYVQNTDQLYKVVDFGSANYQFDEKNDVNFYLKLEKNGQEQILWGKEIPEALEKENIKKGDYIISAERTGKEQVKVKINEYNDNGVVVGHKEIQVYKNRWKITKPNQPFAQPIEQIKNTEHIEETKEDKFQAIETVQIAPETSEQIPINLFTVIDFGKDHKNFDTEKAKSHFLQYQDQNGNNYFLWDKKIPEYLHASKIKVGDLIHEPKITKITEKNFMNDRNEVIQYQEKSYRIDKYTEPKTQKEEQTYTYKVIEFGNAIDKNGEKNFFLKLEKGSEQKILWGANLQEQIKNNKISAGDQLSKVNLVNGKFELHPFVINQAKNTSKVLGQIEERTENKIAEQSNHSTKESENKKSLIVTEQMFFTARDNYQLLSNQLSQKDQLQLTFYENEIKRVTESLAPEDQQKALYTYYEKVNTNFIRGAKLEIPRQFLTTQTTQTTQNQEFSKNIESRAELSL
ncbi:MAG: PriCT-2 domain-containing protein [Neisseriaceae bacterium]|nr:PriCT-2 domain-containing protein [Neisseriaceae bacterium]